MSRMKLAMMQMMALAAMMEPGGSHPCFRDVPPTQDELDAAKRIAERKQKDSLLKKGLKEFVIDGKTVLALNYKNALRKAKLF